MLLNTVSDFKYSPSLLLVPDFSELDYICNLLACDHPAFVPSGGSAHFSRSLLAP